MIMTFSQLFDLQEDTKSVIAKHKLRLGALVIPEKHAFVFGETAELGFDIAKWLDKKFDVIKDGKDLSITRVL
tara:strand:+ start:57 stop:275 length:219 start_codon:yes stop_codon:yes gene_type:complete